MLPNMDCELDFDYSMDTKIIPLSVLMIIAIPQVRLDLI